MFHCSSLYVVSVCEFRSDVTIYNSTLDCWCYVASKMHECARGEPPYCVCFIRRTSLSPLNKKNAIKKKLFILECWCTHNQAIVIDKFEESLVWCELRLPERQ